MSAALVEPGRRVVVSVDPEAGESLAGYLCRVASENIVSGPRRLLPSGVAWPPSHLKPEEMSQLATELGCDRAAMERLFANSRGGGLGPRLRSWSRRRLSPASLRLAAYHRAHWQMRLPYCPETWGALIEECPECRTVLTWQTNALDRCQRCWFDLRFADAPFAKLEDRAELGFISNLVVPGRTAPIGPEWANFLSGPELFELIVLTGRALRPGGARSPDREADLLISGLRAILGAPGSIEILAKLHENEAEHPFLTRMRSFAGLRSGPVRDAIRLLLSSKPDDPGVRRLKRARTSRGLKTATEAAAQLQIERSQLRKLVGAGLLVERSPRGVERTYGWFNQGDVDQMQTLLRSRVSAGAWSRRMGLSDIEVRQLLADRLIDEHPDARLQAVLGGLQLDARRAAEFEKSIRRCCSDSRATEAWVPVRRAFRGIGGGYKPWGLLMRMAIDGGLLHGLGLSPLRKFQIGNLVIHPDDAAWILGRVADEAGLPAFKPERFGAYRSDRLSWGDVETVLNCNPADVARLLDHSEIRRTGDGEDFEALSVESFAQRNVSSLEIASLTGRGARSAVNAIARSGWPRPEIGFWSRADLPQIVASLQPRAWKTAWEAQPTAQCSVDLNL